MQHHTAFRWILTTALTALCLTGCTLGEGFMEKIDHGASQASRPVNSVVDRNEPLREQTFVADEASVLPLGRTYFDEDNLLWCAHSGAGAAFTFCGTSAAVTLQGDIASTFGNPRHYARVAIYANGQRVVDAMLDKKERTFQVFDSNAPEEVEIRIVKLSETAMSTFAVKDITVMAQGGIAPAAEKPALIEFIGDSITCGYGVDEEDKDGKFSTGTEDATKTYAWKAAEQLGVDCSLVAVSGFGVFSGFTSSGDRMKKQIMPPYYEKLGYSSDKFGDKKPAELDWDFTKREPDIVVVNLGTNDDSYCQNSTSRRAEFMEAYVDFLKTVRECNPNARILCTLGIMGDRLYPSMEEAMEDYTAETGDTKISALKFDVQDEEDGYAVDWHPTEATQQKAADRLVEELRQWIPSAE